MEKFFFLPFKALQYHEDYAEALASYGRALELDSENEDARNNQEQLLSYLRTITDLLACKVCFFIVIHKLIKYSTE